MSCTSAKFDPDEGRYYCEVSGDQCMYYIPNSKRCAEEYWKGPDVVDDVEPPRICFGNYYDKNGNVCLDGQSGLCSYCVECQKECVYY